MEKRMCTTLNFFSHMYVSGLLVGSLCLSALESALDLLTLLLFQDSGQRLRLPCRDLIVRLSLVISWDILGMLPHKDP